MLANVTLWGASITDWLGLAATIALIIVTWIYTRATKKMADTARQAAADSKKATEAAERSADAAERSVQASLRAAHIAESQLDISFRAEVIAIASDVPGGEPTPGLVLRSTGAAVFVQSVRIRYGFKRLPNGRTENEPSIEDAEMSVAAGLGLPRRLQGTESVALTHRWMDEGEWPTGRMILDVGYAYSATDGQAGTKQVSVDAPRRNPGPDS